MLSLSLSKIQMPQKQTNSWKVNTLPCIQCTNPRHRFGCVNIILKAALTFEQKRPPLQQNSTDTDNCTLQLVPIRLS